MAITVKLANANGTLDIIDDEYGKIGTGRAVPSKTEPNYITLTMRIRNPIIDLKKNKVAVDDFVVLRVPINWLEIDSDG